MGFIPLELSNLNPRVRSKAVSIAEKLMEKDSYTEEEAVEEAIKKAEERYFGLGG